MQVGCYTLDLYCDNPECPVRTIMPRTSGTESPGIMNMAFAQFISEFGAKARQAARRKGWRLAGATEEDGKDLCPTCAKGRKLDGV